MKDIILSVITITILLTLTAAIFVKNNSSKYCEEKVCVTKCQCK
jgi:hypothetical protein